MNGSGLWSAGSSVRSRNHLVAYSERVIAGEQLSSLRRSAARCKISRSALTA